MGARRMGPPPSTSRAALAVFAAALLLLVDAASSSHGGAHSPLVDDVPARSRLAADHHDEHGAPVACTAGEWCVGAAGEATTRRELGGGNYIGYDAMRRNAVPCSYRGASYYNCRPGGQANPYSRGCSAITQCRG